MAVIQGYNPNDPDKNKQQPAGGASTSSTTSQASGPTSTPQAQNKSQPASGSFQNFGNYAQANKQSGERIGNVLSQNIQGQAQNVRASSGAVTEQQTAAQKEQDRIKQGLEQVRGAVNTGQGFQQFLQPPPATNAPAPQQANNPVYSNLADWAQKLSTGQTDAQQIQNQGNASAMTAQRQLTGLQNQQQRLGTEPGRFQLLKDILGKTGGYSNPAARLDQALLQTNTNALDKVIKGAQTSVSGEQQNLQDKRQAFESELSNLGTAKDASLKELRGTDTEQGLLGKGLTNVDTSLEQQQKEATTKRQTEQADITKQFQDQEFEQSIADQLGIGEGTTLFNLLKDSPEAYKKYVDLADPNGINKSNVINQDQLLQYSALQKMLGKDTSQFAYKDIGTVDPSYNLQGDKFKGDLSDLYNTRADQADSDVITGHGQANYISGYTWENPFKIRTDRSNVDVYKQAAVKQILDSQMIRDAVAGFKNVNTPEGELQATQQVTLDPEGRNRQRGITTGATKTAIGAATGALRAGPIGALLGGIPGYLDLAKSGLAELASGLNLFGMGGRGQATGDASRDAVTDLQNQWKNYLNSKGYNDTAKIRQALQAQNKVGADTPTGLQG